MVILIILTVCVFVSWLFISHKLTRYIIGSLSIIALLFMIIGITLNMSQHWGMEKKTITSPRVAIFTAGDKNSPANMLIANEIGTKSGNYVMVYRDHAEDQKATTHYKPKTDKEHLSESVKKHANYRMTNTDKATVQTTSQVWVWKSDWYKTLFSFDKHQQELIKSNTTVTVPKDTWVVLNAEQVKKIQHQQAGQHNSKSVKSRQKHAMEQIIIKYRQEHPNASQEEINQYIKHQQAVLATKQIKQSIDE